MEQSIINLLSSNRVCVLTVVMPDGTPHSSVMHYSHALDPLVLYFSTDIKTKKCIPLQNHQSASASVAVGFSETEWLTIQMSGSLRIISDSEHLSPEKVASIKGVHYSKHPASAKYADDPDTVFLEFIPSWWRYSDFIQKPPHVIESK